MRISILIIILGLVVISCKDQKPNDAEVISAEEQISQDANTFQGEFIFSKEAAVLKGDDFIYGVALNDLAQDLAGQVAKVKTDEYDMVPVIVKGDLSSKPEGTEGWDEILTISEIVHVSETPAAAGIQLKKK